MRKKYDFLKLFLLFIFLLASSRSAWAETEDIRDAQQRVRQEVIRWALDYQQAVGKNKKAVQRDLPYREPPRTPRLTETMAPNLKKKTTDVPEGLYDLSGQPSSLPAQSFKKTAKNSSVRKNIIQKELDRMEFSFEMSSGLRRDDLQWSIKAADGSPNILSELTWSDLLTYQVGGEARMLWNKRVRVESSLAYGWIFNGNNQDSDYYGDDRALEFLRSNATTSDDNTLDFSIGLGYQFAVRVPKELDWLADEDLKVVVLAGYAYDELNLRDKEGYQDIPHTGSFDGLNSTYKTEWQGPWFGLELVTQRKNFRGFSRFEYHLFDYAGFGNWNLRDDFAHPLSFDQTASGHGMNLKFGGELDVTTHWTCGVKFDIRHWRTSTGWDNTYRPNGDINSYERFNGAEWTTYAGMLTATYHFPFLQPKEGSSEEWSPFK